eukprot:282821-Rhodomonas_salina.1
MLGRVRCGGQAGIASFRGRETEAWRGRGGSTGGLRLDRRVVEAWGGLRAVERARRQGSEQ